MNMQITGVEDTKNLAVQLMRRIREHCVTVLRLPTGVAVKHDWIELQTAFESGCSLTLSYNYLERSLLIASISNCPDFFSYLLEKGCEVNETDFNGWTALHHACCKGYSEIVEALIRNGADLHLVTHEDQSPLMLAIKFGHIGIVKQLLHRIDYQKIDRYGMQNLHFAVLSKSNQIVELVLPDYKDVINQQDADGNSALLLACRDGLEDIAITLLENGASPFIVNGYGSNILHCIGATGLVGVLPWLWHYFTLAEFALFINTRNDYGWTPLHMACQRGYEGTIVYFLEFYADPTICNNEGMSASDIVKSSAWYFSYSDHHQRRRRILSRLKKSKLGKESNKTPTGCLVSIFS